MESSFLQAFQGTNKKVPVWFMRQAGRFLPEYQTLRAKHSLDEMFRNPDIAAEVTCLPIDILGVDAAILFADILTLPAQLGFEISFSKNGGPAIANPIQSPSDVERIGHLDDIPQLRETIQKVNQKLPAHIPLIGFAGSPFTVLCYLIEGGSSVNFHKTLNLAFRHPQSFHKAMELLTDNTIRYLKLQKEAGIKAFQIFDTWAGILRAEDYKRIVFPYIQNIFTNVNLPSIYYAKNSAHLLDTMDQCQAEFLSLCNTVDLENNPVLLKSKKGIQGNLFNGLLYAEDQVLTREVDSLLRKAKKFKRYIFNLSHGVFPDTDVAKVKKIVEQVHSFAWTN